MKKTVHTFNPYNASAVCKQHPLNFSDTDKPEPFFPAYLILGGLDLTTWSYQCMVLIPVFVIVFFILVYNFILLLCVYLTSVCRLLVRSARNSCRLLYSVCHCVFYLFIIYLLIMFLFIAQAQKRLTFPLEYLLTPSLVTLFVYYCLVVRLNFQLYSFFHYCNINNVKLGKNFSQVIDYIDWNLGSPNASIFTKPTDCSNEREDYGSLPSSYHFYYFSLLLFIF